MPDQPASVLVGVALTPPEDIENDFNRWYSEEHIRLLSRVPGWLRSRRFELLEGRGPKYLALHEYARINGLTRSSEFQAATTTEWTKRSISACKQNGSLGYERHEWYRETWDASRTKLIKVVSQPDGSATVVEEDVQIETTGWIGSKSTRSACIYPFNLQQLIAFT